MLLCLFQKIKNVDIIDAGDDLPTIWTLHFILTNSLSPQSKGEATRHCQVSGFIGSVSKK